MKSSLNTQCGGGHYKNRKIQPVELAEILGATPEFCKASKYIIREKDNKLEDINKAIHCIELERDLGVKWYKYPYNTILGLKGRLLSVITKQFVIHPIICEYTNDYFIQRTLAAMLQKDYVSAIWWAKRYRDNL